MRSATPLAPLVLALGLAACQAQTDDSEDPQSGDPPPQATATPEPDESATPEPVSILRPDIAPPATPEVPLEPLEVTVGFPEGGMELDAAATAVLEEVVNSEQVATGAPLVLRSHTDSGGSDAGNLRASEKRGKAVKQWLVDQGIAPERITVIAFGEQNPVAPNALPDGSPNEQGRQLNRRVEIAVIPVPDETVSDDDTAAASAGAETAR